MTAKKQEVDKPIKIDLFVVKGNLTFKQAIIILLILIGGVGIAFSAFSFKSKVVSYEKKPINIKTDKFEVRTSTGQGRHSVENKEAK